MATAEPASSETHDGSPPDALSACERRRLAEQSAAILRLEIQLALADEGYRMIQEAAARARAEADTREARARDAHGVLLARLEAAREAERRLERLLPAEVFGRWRRAQARLREIRALLDQARREGRCREHLEAALELAEADWRVARAAALDDR